MSQVTENTFSIIADPIVDCINKTIKILFSIENGCGPFQYKICIGQVDPDDLSIVTDRKIVSITNSVLIPISDIKFAIEITIHVTDACGKTRHASYRIGNFLNRVTVGGDIFEGNWQQEPTIGLTQRWIANGAPNDNQPYYSYLTGGFIAPVLFEDSSLFVCQRFNFASNSLLPPSQDGLNVTYTLDASSTQIACPQVGYPYTISNLNNNPIPLADGDCQNPSNPGKPGYSGNQPEFRLAEYSIGQVDKDVSFLVRINAGWSEFVNPHAPAPNAEIDLILLWAVLDYE